MAGAGYAAASAEPWHAALHVTIAGVFWWWAGRLRRSPSAGDESDLRARLEQQAEVLDATQAQLAELQERVDFAERLLVQLRDRPVLDQRNPTE